jgi:benzoyl-CoA reductase/2-hydroxyglutaryl-CoA dehydratase subunit BcrC/BadD/HgdB
LIDAPFLYQDIRDHDLTFVKSQIEDAISVAEQVAGKSLNYQRLTLVAEKSLLATQLWNEILNLNRNHPAPISAIDQFIHMAPIVEMRGEEYTVRFYQGLLDEVKGRVRDGIGAVKDEKKRLLWDNLPIWYRLRFVAEHLGARGAAIVASTYTNAWAELSSYLNARDPIDSMARTYIHAILNRSTGDKLKLMKSMVSDYAIDGVILHSDRSCKPYSVGQIDQRDRIMGECEIPAVLVEADHNDPRAFSEEQVVNRLDAFLEMLED